MRGWNSAWRWITGIRRPGGESTNAAAHSAALLAANSRDILSRHSRDGAILWISPAVETVLGVGPEEYVGKFAELVHPDDAATVYAALAAVLAGRPVKVVVRSRHS